MTAQDVQDKVLRRVRKMMKLAQDAGATEGERDTAMRMVHSTLAKYNISMSQVGSGEATEEAREKLRQTFLGKPWAINIAGAIARMYFCRYFYQTLGGNAGPTQKALHTFIGRHSNVVTAEEMSRFVVESVNREAQRFQRQTGGRYADYRAFAQGAAAKIAQRCAQIQHEAEQEGLAATPADEEDAATPAGTALVLANLYKTELEQNEAWMEQQGIKTSAGRTQTYDPTKVHARLAGIDYGAKVSLHTQVTGKSPKQIK